MSDENELFIKVSSVPASDSWGFVGLILVGEHEAYRSIRAYDSPRAALDAVQELLAGVLGALAAGQEWRAAQDEFGHAPRRVELEFGLRGHARLESATGQAHESVSDEN